MKINNYLTILGTIFLAFWLENFINQHLINFYIEFNVGFLVFSYWVFAMHEKLQAFSALAYGVVVDLFFFSALGFNMLFFTAMSYLINLYVFRFRIFSYLQLSIFFSASSIFYLACKYLLFSPLNYSYLMLLNSFIFNMILWVGLYFVLRSFRRKFLSM
jgi:rod shape-determining protein MreD